MVKQWFKDKRQIGFLILMATLVIVQAIRIGDSLGIYQDAIMSDYASARFINQQKYSYSYFGVIGNIQFIGAFYHGNLTMFWTLFVSLLTGTTSALQYRIGTSCWAILCIAIIQFFLYRQKIDRKISFVTIFLLTLSPAFISTTFTEDYSYLPGTAFFLLSVINMLSWIESKYENKKRLFVSFFWIGLAVYSYIVYFLYFIVLLAIAIIFARKNKPIDALFCAGFGALAGVYPYIAGFYNIMYGNRELFNYSYRINTLLWISTIAIIALGNVFLYYLGKQIGKYLTKAISVLISVFVSVIPIIVNYQNINGFRQQLISRTSGTTSTSMSFVECVLKLFQRLYTVFTNVRRENDILGYPVSRVSMILPLSLLVVLAVFVGVIICNKKERKPIPAYNDIIILLASQVGYIVLVFIFFIGGLNQGHFTTFYIISFVEISLMSNVLVSIMQEEGTLLALFMKKSIIALLLVNCIVCYVNTGILTEKIIRSGGHGEYTNQTNVLAESALEIKSQGIKEMYFFPEWGFVCNFMYLTGNTVSFRPIINEIDRIQIFIDEGYTTFKVVFFDKDMESEYLNYYGGYSDLVDKKISYTKDGEYAFTTLVLEVK